MGRSENEDSCLVCGEKLDVHGRHVRLCGGNVATLAHTHLKHAPKTAVIAVAANPESGVANVRSEEPGMVANNSRPGDDRA